MKWGRGWEKRNEANGERGEKGEEDGADDGMEEGSEEGRGRGRREDAGCGRGRREKKGPTRADGSFTSGCGLPPHGEAPPADRRAPQLPGSLARLPSRSSRAAAAGAGTARLTAAASPRRALDAASREAAAAEAAAARPVWSPSSAAAGARGPSSLAAGGSHGLLRSLLPPPALCGGSSQASVLCACAWRCQRGAPLPRTGARVRALALTHNRAAGWYPRRLRYTGGRHTPPAAYTARLPPLWRRVPCRHLHAHCDTHHSDTRALSHSQNTRSHTRSHPHLPARTTWENWRGRSLTRCNRSSKEARFFF